MNNILTLQRVNQLNLDAYEQLALKYHESFKDEMTYKEYDKKILDQFSEILPSINKICDGDAIIRVTLINTSSKKRLWASRY
jgi:hypothetical protein